jgi:hypothetical protein
MSHITEVELQITDLSALAEAAAVRGLQWKPDQHTYQVYGDTPECIHAMGVPGDSQAYEIGVVAGEKPGTYELRYDPWDRQLEQFAGVGLAALRQEYAAQVSERQIKRQLGRAGWVSRREMLPTGAMKIHVTRR